MSERLAQFQTGRYSLRWFYFYFEYTFSSFLLCLLHPIPYFLSSFLTVRFSDLQMNKNNRNLGPFHFSHYSIIFHPSIIVLLRIIFVLTCLTLDCKLGKNKNMYCHLYIPRIECISNTQ